MTGYGSSPRAHNYGKDAVRQSHPEFQELAIKASKQKVELEHYADVTDNHINTDYAQQDIKKVSKVSSNDGEEISVAHSFVMLSRINAPEKLVDALNQTNNSHSPITQQRATDEQNTPSVHHGEALSPPTGATYI